MSSRIAVLVSGGGSNLQAVFNAIDAGAIRGEVCLVLSSAEKAYALQRARARGVPALALARRRFASPAECDTARHQALVSAAPDLIVLAGYLGIVPQETVAAFPGRILNIHPALLPSFGGPGMHGIAVHRAVLAAGCRVSGASVHFVDETVDTGPIVLQGSVPVYENDTPESLAERVLGVEHRILPKAVALFCEGRLSVQGRKATIM